MTNFEAAKKGYLDPLAELASKRRFRITLKKLVGSFAGFPRSEALQKEYRDQLTAGGFNLEDPKKKQVKRRFLHFRKENSNPPPSGTV